MKPSKANPPSASAIPLAGTQANPPAEESAEVPTTHLKSVTDRHVRAEKLRKLARRDPLTRELVEAVSAGEQAAADLVTAKATIASLETQLAASQARVTELEAQLSGKEK